LTLQLRKHECPDGKEYAEFHHLPGQALDDFDAVRREIEAETERMCGNNKALSPQPIILRIFSPNVVDLTLIDLPGITKIPVGDQPHDIEARIRELVLHHVQKPNVIILAVTAANTDIANSDALQLAREVDPEGSRTIGVLTKLDIMDEGTDCCDILMGRIAPLRLGYVGVVCRGQKDLAAKKSVRDALAREEEFFRTHAAYRTLQHCSGTRFLTRRLNEVLMKHIKGNMPELRSRILAQIGENEAELRKLGEPLAAEIGGHGPLLLHVIQSFSQNFAEKIEGRQNKIASGASDTELCGGARLHYIFHDIFARALLEHDPFNNLDDETIRATIRNAAGPRASLFVPEAAFELLVKRQVAQLEAPSLECAELVFEELKKLVSATHTDLPELLRFHHLRESVFEVAHHILLGQMQPTQQMIASVVHMQLAYVNTGHPDFDGGLPAMHAYMQATNNQEQPMRAPPPQDGPPPPSLGSKLFSGLFPIGATRRRFEEAPREEERLRLAAVPDHVELGKQCSERERTEMELVKAMLQSYFHIVAKTIVDMVPKAIMHFLVNPAKDVMQRELIARLYKEDHFARLLSEDPGVAEGRQMCKANVEALRRAMQIINTLRDSDLRA
jgi:dynamin 1-like protein